MSIKWDSITFTYDVTNNNKIHVCEIREIVKIMWKFKWTYVLNVCTFSKHAMKNLNVVGHLQQYITREIPSFLINDDPTGKVKARTAAITSSGEWFYAGKSGV